jgi:exosortase
LLLQRWHASSESRKQPSGVAVSTPRVETAETPALSGERTFNIQHSTSTRGSKVEGRGSRVEGAAAETVALPGRETFNTQHSTSSAPGFGKSKLGLLVVGLALLALLYLPTRLIELAIPEWRPVQWSLGFIAVGLTLGWIYLNRGKSGLKLFAFPICFFLVAIPWPTPIEQPIIQTLTRINAAMVIEVMGVMGIPALQHGNVIEVGTGVVGIDEACSGIRSFQSSLMISLFLGALYQLRVGWRTLFVVIGFLMAMVFNVIRTSFLTYVAAREGVAAIDKYHDPAGLWIMIGCTLGLWGVGMMMRTKKQCATDQGQLTTDQGPRTTDQGPGTADDGPGTTGPRTAINLLPSTINRLSVALAAWLVLVELGSQVWYRAREARLPAAANWSLQLPTENPTFQEFPMAAKTLDLLRFDDGKQGGWVETNGLRLQTFYFNWRPGRVAGYLAKRHTPEACMPATGREMMAGPELLVSSINGLELPIRRYRFGPDGNSLHVFHCRWEAGASAESFVEQESTRLNLLRAIWAGRGNQGQKVIEIIISGTEDSDEATALLRLKLAEMIQVEEGK